MIKNRNNQQQGFLSIVAVVIIAIFGFIGVMAAYLINSNMLSGINNLRSTQAFDVAEAGLERATRGLLHPIISGGTGTNERIACSSISGNANFTNSNAGISVLPGLFTVTATSAYPATPTTLTAAISSATSTAPIRVASVANYATSGRLMIDREYISYSGTSSDSTTCGGTPPCFIGITRGVDSSVATTHVSGTPVGQYQCTITAVGGIPNLTSPLGKRTVQEAVQLQEAWIVGSTATTLRFNNTAWSNFANTLPNTQLNAVSMSSYASGWAVGMEASGTYVAQWNGVNWSRYSLPDIAKTDLYGIDCPSNNDCWAVGTTIKNDAAFLHWDGSAWTQPTYSSIPKADLYSVYCVSGHDCWVVGERVQGSSSGEVIGHWDGTTWTRSGPSASISDANLYSVTCVNSADCWAVGDLTGGAPLIVHWDGAAWSQIANSLPTRLNGVACASTNNCWAVGNASSGEVIAHWNGSSWTRYPVSASVPNVNLHAVACANDNDCWIAGSNTGGEVILHWDGSAWSRYPVSAGIPDVDLYGIALITPHRQPWSAWQEIFP